MNVSPRNSIRSFPSRTYSSTRSGNASVALCAIRALEVGELDERHGRIRSADRRPVLGNALEERPRLGGTRKLDARPGAAAPVVAGGEQRSGHDRCDHDRGDPHRGPGTGSASSRPSGCRRRARPASGFLATAPGSPYPELG